jgi:hypothetical protein
MDISGLHALLTGLELFGEQFLRSFTKWLYSIPFKPVLADPVYNYPDLISENKQDPDPYPARRIPFHNGPDPTSDENRIRIRPEESHIFWKNQLGSEVRTVNRKDF